MTTIAKGAKVRIVRGPYHGHYVSILRRVCGGSGAWIGKIDGMPGLVMVYESEMEG